MLNKETIRQRETFGPNNVPLKDLDHGNETMQRSKRDKITFKNIYFITKHFVDSFLWAY